MSPPKRPAADNGERALILLPIALFLVMLFLFRPFVIDDTYITFRYAQNLVDGGTISYNMEDKQPVEGYTSFLWMLISAGAIAISADPLVVVRLFSIAAGVGALLILRLLAFRMTGNYLLSFLPPLLLAVSAEFSMWTIAGLETTFFLFLLLLSLYLLAREIESGGGPWWGVSFALLALTRPEGIAFFAVAFVCRAGVHFMTTKTSGSRLQTIVLAAVYFLGIFAPYWIWKFNYYGLPLPNSYYAKHGANEGAGYIKDFLIYLAPVTLLALGSLLIRIKKAKGLSPKIWAALIWGIILVNFAGVWNVKPAMAWDWRLFVHLLPLFYLASLPLLERLISGAVSGGRQIAACLAILLTTWIAHPELFQARVAECRATGDGLREAHIEIGRLLKDKLDPGTLVVVVDTGAIAWYSGLPCLDMAGIPLNNAPLARNQFTEEDFWATNPGAIVMRGDEQGRIAFRRMHKQILEKAMEIGFVRYASAMHKPDYYVWVFLKPVCLKEVEG